MKRMIDTEKFLDKLLYMGYMDEEKSEIEEVANRMTEYAYNKDEVIAMLEELKEEITALPMYYDPLDIGDLIQQKINALMEKDNDK